MDVGGTVGFNDIDTPLAPNRTLPLLLPATDGSSINVLGEFARELPGAAVGLRRVFNAKTHTVQPRFDPENGGAHSALGLDAHQVAVLSGYGTDPDVEAWWSAHVHQQLCERIRDQDWDLVLAPNYSLYGSYPRFEMLLNYRRNLLIAQRFTDAGVPVAPNLYWFRLEDLKRYASWAADTSPTTLAVNLQTYRTDADWDQMLIPGLMWLSVNMPAGIHWVFTTGIRFQRWRILMELFGQDNITLILQAPWQYAMHGKHFDGNTFVSHPAQPADNFAITWRRLEEIARGGARHVGDEPTGDPD